MILKLKPSELYAKGKALADEIDKLETQLGELTGDDEDTKAKAEKLDGEVQAKTAEFDEVRTAIEGLKRAKSRREALDAVKPDADGKSVTDDGAGDDDDEERTLKAQARSHAKEARQKREFFLDYACGKSLSGQAMDLLAPTSPAMLKSDAAAGGVVVPDSVAVGIFGKRVGAAMGFDMGKATMLSTDSDRTALIPEDYRASLLELPAEEPHILPRATVIPAPTGTVTWPRLVQGDSSEYGGVTVSWIDEGGEKAETDADFEQVQVSTHECAGYTEVSHTLLSRSAIGLEQLIARLFRGAMNDALDTKFIQGSGTGEPLGIINTTGIRTQVRNTASQVKHADLVALKYALRAYHRAGATFLCADDVLEYLEASLDSQNRPLFSPSVAGTIPDRLVGRPYISSHRLPALGSDADVVLVDLREYIVAMEKEVVVKRSDHYKFRNNLAAFTVTVLAGGQLVQPRVGVYLTASTS